MNILVIGCGSFGSAIAVELEKAGHEISIIDKSYDSFLKLPDDFRGKRNNGDVLVHDVILRSRIEQAEAVILTISDDVMNLTIARMLMNKFAVKKIIALNTNPNLRGIYDEMNIPTVSMVSWGVLRIGSMLTANSEKSSLTVGNSEVGVYNVIVPASAKEIDPAAVMSVEQCMVFAISHEGFTRAMNKEVPVVPGDVLHVSTSTEGLRSLYSVLGMIAKEEETK